MEKKFLNAPFEIEEIYEEKSENKQFGIIRGLASTFGNVDKGRDRVLKGAFNKTLDKYSSNNRQIRMFYQHDYKNVIGGFEVYKETRKGLYVEGKINLEVQKGREAYALAKQGVMTDFSIGYYATDFEWISEKVAEKDGNDVFMDIRNLKEIELTEISLVSNPMNEQAVVTEVKEKTILTITDISRRLKEKGFSNKETNEIIYFIKSTARNESVDENDVIDLRNEVIDKINEFKLESILDVAINNLKRK